MFIRYIFGLSEGPPEDGKGLWAMVYPDEAGNIDCDNSIDVLEEIFRKWRDPEYMYNFCKENFNDIKIYFARPITISRAANHLMDEADKLEDELLEAAATQTAAKNLQSIFKPLNDNETAIFEIQSSKTKIKKGEMKGVAPILRLYAVRVDEDTYIITGGAIKLTHKMEQRQHTKNEKIRIQKVCNWLKDLNVTYSEDLNYL